MNNIIDMDPQCVNKINKLKNKLCKEKNNLCKENKVLKKTLNFYKKLKKPDLDFLFFINGSDIVIDNIDSNTYKIRVENKNSNALLFTDIPFHITADICNLKNFKTIVNATNSQEIEDSLGVSKINSYKEPFKTFLKEYKTPFPFVKKEAVSTIVLFGTNNEIFNNISELVSVECDNDTVILEFKVTGNIKIPDEGSYNRVSITISGFSDTYIGNRSNEVLPSKFLFQINP